MCVLKYQKIQIEDNSQNNKVENKKNEEIKAINMLLDNYEKGFTSEDYNISEIDKEQDEASYMTKYNQLHISGNQQNNYFFIYN